MTTHKTKILKQLEKSVIELILLFSVFYLASYLSVSDIQVNSYPLHHDDYSNYSLGKGSFNLSFVRPVSYSAIYFLSSIGENALIWSVRILTVAYVWLVWIYMNQFYAMRRFMFAVVLFGIACYFSPLVISYGRYTGMMTHLLSGCLGITSLVFLSSGLKKQDCILLALSSIFIVLSALSKEDFVLLYMFSLIYYFIVYRRIKYLYYGLVGIAVSVALILLGKIVNGSPFVSGANFSTNPYAIDVTVPSLVITTYKYLSNAGHSAATAYGHLFTILFGYALVLSLSVSIKIKAITKGLYVVISALCLIAPYAVLPNHIFLFYQFLWAPFIFTAFVFATYELSTFLNIQRNKTFVSLTSLILLVVSSVLYVVDPGRLYIAQWYDSAIVSSRNIHQKLNYYKEQINNSSNVCVYGAGRFSPWYIHGGIYLKNNMKLDTRWLVVSEVSDALYSGFKRAEKNSAGAIRVISEKDSERFDCLKLYL